MKKNMVFLATACALSLTVTQSYAGFEWRGAPTKAQGFVVESAPVSPVETIETIEESGNVDESASKSAPVKSYSPAPQQPRASQQPITWNQTGATELAVPETAPFEPAAEDDIGQIIRKLNTEHASQASAPTSAPVAASTSTPVTGDEDGYYGFGKDIPMVMAMEQILPQGYNPAFARNVDMGQRMTWNGDGHWQSTLRQGLNDLGLDFYLKGQNVYIVKDDSKLNDVAGSPAPTGISAEPDLDEDSSTDWLPKNWTAPHSTEVSATSSVKTANQDMMPQQMSKSSYRQPAAESLSNQPVSEPVRDVKSAIPPSRSFSYNEAPVESSKAVSGDWSASADETLRETLQKWAIQDGSSLEWTIDYDYLLKRPVNYSGSFAEAVKTLLDQFVEVEPRPYGQLFKGKQGGYVLRIKAYNVE
jgi:hypothetical protein